MSLALRRSRQQVRAPQAVLPRANRRVRAVTRVSFTMRFDLAGPFSRTIRDAAELLPRYEVDTIFVPDRFKARFPDFRVATVREGLTVMRDEHRPPNDGPAGL